MMRLMPMQTLTFLRSEPGYHDVSGKWVDGSTTPFTVACNLQPYQDGKTTLTLPKGVEARDALICFTESELRTADQYDSTLADVVVIEDAEYVAMKEANWDRYSYRMRLGHHRVILVRRTYEEVQSQ